AARVHARVLGREVRRIAGEDDSVAALVLVLRGWITRRRPGFGILEVQPDRTGRLVGGEGLDGRAAGGGEALLGAAYGRMVGSEYAQPDVGEMPVVRLGRLPEP